MVKRLSTMWETWVRSLGWEVPWRRKWQPTPVLLPRKPHGHQAPPSMGSQRVGHDWVTSLSFFPIMVYYSESESVSGSVMSDSLWPHEHPVLLSVGFSKQEYWSGLPFPSPGNFPTQGSNPGLPHCRQTLYHLSHQGSHEGGLITLRHVYTR